MSTHDGANDYVAIFTPEIDLDPATACLVIVDVMYATGHPETGLGRLLASEGRLHEAEYRYRRIAEKVVPNSKRLLDFCRENDVRRVFLTYGSEVSDFSDLTPQMYTLCVSTNNKAGEREHEIVEELRPLPNERVFNKITPSAFTSTPIDIVLRADGAQTLLFTGVSTNMCVEHTLRDASSYGYACLLVDDACGADSQEMHDAACTVMQRLYGSVITTDEAISRMAARLPMEVASP
jgi:biuret amidohydrolase